MPPAALSLAGLRKRQPFGDLLLWITCSPSFPAEQAVKLLTFHPWENACIGACICIHSLDSVLHPVLGETVHVVRTLV